MEWCQPQIAKCIVDPFRSTKVAQSPHSYSQTIGQIPAQIAEHCGHIHMIVLTVALIDQLRLSNQGRSGG